MANGMASFAQRNAQAGIGRADSPNGGKADYSDLKLPNTSATRAHKKSSKRPKSQSQHAQDNGNGTPFDDTDASEADRTSTTSDVRRDPYAAGQHPQSRQPPNVQQRVVGAQPNYAINPEQYTLGNPQMEAAEDLFQQGLAEANAAERAHTNPIGNSNPAPFAQTYVKGDSYPPTTSGAPSVVEQRARSDSEGSRGQNAALVAHHDQSHSILNLGSKQRARLGATSRSGAELNHAQPQAAVKAQDHRPNSGKSSRASSPAVGGFSFHPAGKKQNLSLPQAALGQQHPGQDPDKDRKASSVPAKKGAPSDLRSSAPRGPPVHQPPGQANRQAAVIVPQYQHNLNIPTLLQQPQETGFNTSISQYQQGFSSDDYGPEDDQNEMRFDVNKDDKSLVQSDDDKPDHELEELYAMDYQELKAESMEKAPDAEPYIIDGLADSASISDKLVAVHKASLTKDPRAAHKNQADFFASMTIDEWEEAGDWFLERFGEVVTKLRGFRREKRKAAKTFEDEIEGRDIAVAAKRKFTEQALQDMRMNGQNVLQGTPQRGKKPK